MMMRPWVCLSSSSGETFSNVYTRLSLTAKDSLAGLFTDRDCKAWDVGNTVLGADRTFKFSKTDFEPKLLAYLAARGFKAGGSELTVFLCGFFGILSSQFLAECPGPILNTHPTLLPAFPGLDQKVQQKAAESVAISGFTVHLVTEVLDGGPVLFQHPVWMNPELEWQENRARVRAAEQHYLPPVLENLLNSDLKSSDRNLSSRALRKRLRLLDTSFTDRELSSL